MISLEPANDRSPPVKTTDPFMKAQACRFNLEDGVAHVTADGDVPYWSVSVYNRRGYNAYSFNDRTASGGLLDLAIVSPAQMIELRKSLPDEFAKSIFVEVEDSRGIVVIRAFMPDETYAPTIKAFFASSHCKLE
jgi:uncharacterized membrane protein